MQVIKAAFSYKYKSYKGVINIDIRTENSSAKAATAAMIPILLYLSATNVSLSTDLVAKLHAYLSQILQFKTYMQFLAARSLCTKFCKVRYFIPLATCKQRLRRSFCTAPSCGEYEYVWWQCYFTSKSDVHRLHCMSL